jgi:hypothetical protein
VQHRRPARDAEFALIASFLMAGSITSAKVFFSVRMAFWGETCGFSEQ